MSKARDLADTINDPTTLLGAALATPNTYTPAAVVGGGTDIVANASLLPTSGNDAGDQYFVTSTNNLMIWNGSGWYKVATVTNASPVVNSAGNATYNFAKDGTPVDIEISATDPEGLSIQYKYNVTVGTVGNIAAISSSATSGGTYTALAENTLTDNRFIRLTPSTNIAHAGNFTLTFSASDGVNVASSSASSFTLSFETFGSVQFGGGTTGDSLLIPNTGTSNDLVIGTADFTLEFWVNADNFNNGGVIYDTREGHANGLMINFNTSGNLRVYANSGYRITMEQIFPGEWHHYAIVRAGGTTKAYLDGVVDTETYTDTNNYTGNKVYVGKHNSNTAADYDGYISNLRLLVGTALYTTDFTPTGPLDSITNTKLLTAHKNNEVVDGSSSTITILKNGGADAHGSNPFPTNTIGYGSVKFDGTNDYVTTPVSTDLTIGTNDFTIEYWAWSNDFNTAQTITDRTASHSTDIIIGTNGSGQHRIYANGGYRILTAATSPKTWNHVAWQRSSNVTKAYLNGAEQTTTYSDTNNYPGDKVVLGLLATLNSSGMNGYISNYREVIGSTVYTPTNGPASGIDFATAGTTTLASNSAFDFGSNDFTIEFFYKWSTNNGYQTVLNHQYNATDACTIQSNTNTYKWGLFGSSLPYVYESSDASVDVWYHYAFVRNGNSIKIYRDGVETYSQTHTGTVGGVDTTELGAGGGAHYDKGMVSNFRVVKGTALYTSAGFAIPTANLTAVSGTSLLIFQENSGSTLSDASGNNVTVNKAAQHNILTSDGPFYSPRFTPPTAPLTAVSNTKLLTLQRSQPDSITNGSYHITSTSNTHITTSTSTDFTLGVATDFTIEFWYKFASSVSSGGYLFDMGNNMFTVYAASTSRLDVWGAGGTINQGGGSVGTSIGDWHHMVVQRTGNVHAFYINGQLQNSKTDSSNVHNFQGNYLRIGNYGGGNGGPYGQNAYFSDVRHVKGTAVYSGNFTPPSGPLTKTGGTYPSTTNVNTSIPAGHTKLLTAQNSSGGYIDNSDSAHTLTAGGTVNVGAGIGNAATDQSSYSHALSQGGDARSAVAWPFNYNG